MKALNFRILAMFVLLSPVLPAALQAAGKESSRVLNKITPGKIYPHG